MQPHGGKSFARTPWSQNLLLLVSDVLNRVDLFSKMASVIALVQACLSLDFEDWMDVFSELHKVPAFVADVRFTIFVGLALLATCVILLSRSTRLRILLILTSARSPRKACPSKKA